MGYHPQMTPMDADYFGERKRSFRAPEPKSKKMPPSGVRNLSRTVAVIPNPHAIMHRMAPSGVRNLLTVTAEGFSTPHCSARNDNIFVRSSRDDSQLRCAAKGVSTPLRCVRHDSPGSTSKIHQTAALRGLFETRGQAEQAPCRQKCCSRAKTPCPKA